MILEPSRFAYLEVPLEGVGEAGEVGCEATAGWRRLPFISATLSPYNDTNELTNIIDYKNVWQDVGHAVAGIELLVLDAQTGHGQYAA